MYTVRDMMNMPAFQAFQMIAGQEGKNREIKTVSVMDAPDIYEWMKGGEFLITSAYVMREHPEQIEDLIVKLVEHGASAFGIKFNRFIDHLPEEALKTADCLKFPIIAIPIEFAFTDIINPVLQEVIDAQSRVLRYTEKLHEAFTQSVLQDRPVEDILNMLESLILESVVFADLKFRKLYASSAGAEYAGYLGDIWEKDIEEQYGDLFPECIRINEEKYGYLLFPKKMKGERPFGEYRKIAVEQAATVLIIKIQKLLSNSQIEAKYREEFVQDLIYHNIKSREEVYNRAALYRWDFQQGAVAVIVDVDDFKERYRERFDRDKNKRMEWTMSGVMYNSTRILKQSGYQISYSKLSDRIVFIVGLQMNLKEKAKFQQVLENLQKELKARTGVAVTIGVGRYQEDIMHISSSFQEAQKAVAIARMLHFKNKISLYEELGIFKLLDQIKDSPEALEMEEAYIGTLMEYDRKNNTELWKTVQTLIACGWSLKRTSEKLFIHYNSMKYRYQKICEVLGEDLRQQDKRLNMQIAVKLHEISTEQKGQIK